MNTFKFLTDLLQKHDVKDLDGFDKVVSEAETATELLKSVTWRSAKSVVRKALRFGIPYHNQAKSVLEIMAKQAEERVN